MHHASCTMSIITRPIVVSMSSCGYSMLAVAGELVLSCTWSAPVASSSSSESVSPPKLNAAESACGLNWRGKEKNKKDQWVVNYSSKQITASLTWAVVMHHLFVLNFPTREVFPAFVSPLQKWHPLQRYTSSCRNTFSSMLLCTRSDPQMRRGP